jgi:CPA1 family monovalent cation:H+ antiporter
MPVPETVLTLMGLLGVGVIAAGLFRKLPVPYTVLLVILGVGLNALSGYWPGLEPLQQLRLTPELVFFVFLPILIFESGFSLNSRQLIKDIAPVTTLAVPALLISTMAIGSGLWLLSPMDLGVALLFGALISATDPVAVISLFKELGTPERLTVLVEGESLMNDATAIVVFSILLGIALHGTAGMADVGSGVLKFLEVFFGGIVVGGLFGVCAVWFLRRFHISFSAVMMLSVILGYVSFILAEHELHVSGVMAVVACAVMLAIFAMPRLPELANRMTRESWEFLGLVANTLLFIMVGLSVEFSSMVENLELIVVAIVLVQLVRAAIVYSLVPVTTYLFKLPTVTLGERHLMWWGGLKGGLAFAMVLSIPEGLAQRQLLIDMTVGVVLFTLLVNASTIRPLIRWIGMDRLTDDEKGELQHAIAIARASTDDVLEQFVQQDLFSPSDRDAVQSKMENVLETMRPDISGEMNLRYLHLNALRAEQRKLDELYSAGLFKQYIYLDIKGELQRKRDHVTNQQRLKQPLSPWYMNPFVRFESRVIKRLKEYSWASGLLTRYQKLRLSQHLIKDILRSLMAEAAMDYIEGENAIDMAEKETLRAHYRKRLALYHDNIANVRVTFPAFFTEFGLRTSTRAALIGALRSIEKAFHEGTIGAKAHDRLEKHLHGALHSVPEIKPPDTRGGLDAIVRDLPLFAGLPRETVEQILRGSSAVEFLPGDMIIEQGEHSGALYVILRGSVHLTRGVQGVDEEVVRELRPGEAFGQEVLLEDHEVATNVRANAACTVLRIPAEQAQTLVACYPELGARLNQSR